MEQMWGAMKRARGMVITAGAGMGVDSGLPDFRGSEGFWSAYPPMKRLGLSFPEVSTPSWFESDPSFAWGFFGHRYSLYKNATPHDGFQKLLGMAREMPEGHFVVTSNVDGHFQKAGFDPERVLEVHGSIHYWQCHRSCQGIWDAAEEVQVDAQTFRAVGELPRCPKCQAYARPNVLMFNDYSFQTERYDEQDGRYDAFVNQLLQQDAPFVVIEIGAGIAVPTIRMIGEHLVTRSSNGFLIRMNPRDNGIPSQLRKKSFALKRTALDGIGYLEPGEDSSHVSDN